MNKRKYDILFFASDALVSTGFYQLIQCLPISLNVLEVKKIHDINLICKKFRPKLVVFLFNDNMVLNGVFHSIYQLQQNYPDIRKLIITKKLISVFNVLKAHLTSTNVVSLKMSLPELSYLITAELMGYRQSPKNKPRDFILPDRQLKVLLMLSWCYSAEQVARELGISAKTVYAHKLNALSRLQIHKKQDIADLYSVIDELRMIVTMLRYQLKGKATQKSDNKRIYA